MSVTKNKRRAVLLTTKRTHFSGKVQTENFGKCCERRQSQFHLSTLPTCFNTSPNIPIKKYFTLHLRGTLWILWTANEPSSQNSYSTICVYYSSPIFMSATSQKKNNLIGKISSGNCLSWCNMKYDLEQISGKCIERSQEVVSGHFSQHCQF